MVLSYPINEIRGGMALPLLIIVLDVREVHLL